MATNVYLFSSGCYFLKCTCMGTCKSPVDGQSIIFENSILYNYSCVGKTCEINIDMGHNFILSTRYHCTVQFSNKILHCDYFETIHILVVPDRMDIAIKGCCISQFCVICIFDLLLCICTTIDHQKKQKKRAKDGRFHEYHVCTSLLY